MIRTMSWVVIVAPEYLAWLTSLPHESRKALAVDFEVLRMAGYQSL